MIKTIILPTSVAAVIAAKLGHHRAACLSVEPKVEFWAALRRACPSDGLSGAICRQPFAETRLRSEQRHQTT
jgi:hypothetical protein